ncbi:hypothetical protein GCM10027589_12100 [Actinocorallia lasiicapitis]
MNGEDREQLRAFYPVLEHPADRQRADDHRDPADRLGLTAGELVAGLSMTLLENTPARLLPALATQPEIEEFL